ncbi:uncharacterized protein [Littorina saxatilis]|uniref:uncharacterized protein n=1 Tax=Littorina saxatilis TaxID=31220 RepID=UPI0038B4A243
MAAGRGERYTLMVVASVLSALPALVQGAPPYTSRHPRREPPCNHDTHATLCWAVQLKQPLHFNLSPVKHSPQQSVIKEPDLPIAESTGDSSVPSATKVSKLTLLTNMNSTVGNLVTNLSQPVPSVDSEQSRLKQSRLSEQGSVSFNQSSSQSLLLFSSYDDTGNFGKENKSLLNALLRAKLVSPDTDVAQTAGEKSNRLSDQSDITDFSHHEDTDSSRDSSRQQKAYVYRQLALLLAAEVELSLLGKVGELYDHFVLCHESDGDEKRSQGWSPTSSKAFQHYHKAHTELKNTDEATFEGIKERVEASLHGHHDVAWFNMEAVHHRQKRSLTFNDPALIKQWHFVNTVELHMDINVTGVWERGFTGTGVTVAVVDDGLERKNPEIHNNYNFLGSWDLNDNDPDPSPHAAKASNHHGTRCAGEIAAVANNSVCGVGVAYGAKLAALLVSERSPSVLA